MQRNMYLLRLSLLVCALLAAFTALGSHYYTLQVERHDELHRKAQRKYTASQKQRGERGAIYDVDGNLLVGNLACRDVLAEPERFSSRRQEVIRLLDGVLNVEHNVLRRRFKRAVNPDRNVVEVVVKRDIPIQKARHLAELLQDKELAAGFRFVDSTKRYYPKDKLLANVLGFLNPDEKGVSGIESLMQKRLTPTERKIVYEHDRFGRHLNSMLTTDNALPRDGADVYLTISEPIQQIVEAELEKLSTEHKPKAVSAVMIDPSTGAVMAMAQRPTFNPNRREHMAPRNWQNRVVTEGFEPGSIMKPITVAGALDYGIISLNDTYDCEDGIWYYGGSPLHDTSPHEELPVWQIVQKSSNIGAGKIGVELGKGRLYQVLRRFGYGQPTGIGFSNEASGILRPPQKWSKIAVTRQAIGQGILATPLQVAQAYAALANDGVIMDPYIVEKIAHPDNTVAEKNSPQAKRRAVRPESARKVTEVLKLVTTAEGTAPQAALPPYEVAGKTGTAQKVIDGEYSDEHYVSSFAGYVPANDPAFVLLVSVDDPSGDEYYASQVAAPSFRRIAQRTLKYLQVSPRGRGISLTLSSE